MYVIEIDNKDYKLCELNKMDSYLHRVVKKNTNSKKY